MRKMGAVCGLSLALACIFATPADAIIFADGEVTFDFDPLSGAVSPSLTPQDVRVGRTEPGRLTINSGSRLSIDSAVGADPGLIIARRGGSGGSAVVIDSGAIDLTGGDLPGGIFVHIGREGFGRMTIQNGGEFNLINPDIGISEESGAGLSVGRSIGGGELLLDNGSVTLDSEDSAFAIGREGATATVTARNEASVTVLGDSLIDRAAGASISIGRSSSANATMTVDDSDVTVRSDSVARIFVGREEAVGRLEVAGVESDVIIDSPDTRLVVGRDESSTGRVRFDREARVRISGDDADLEIARVGGADGAVVIAGGAVVDVSGLDGDARIAADFTGLGGENDGGIGRLEVRGAGSALLVQDGVLAGSPVSFGGTGTPSASIIIADGGSITADRVLIGRGASLAGDGGSIVGALLNDGGLIAPGFLPGSITVDSFLQTAGTLFIEVAGLAPGQFDVLNVLGDAAFSGGSIAFSFLDGFLPSAGDIIPFLTATGDVEITDTDFFIDGVLSGFDFSVLVDGGKLALFANNDALAVPEPLTHWLVLWGLFGLGLVHLARPSRFRHSVGAHH